MAVKKKRTLKFKTEVSQLLQLMIHSLYSNKEIFLRELISNASDACDKLRFESLANKKLLTDDTELAVEIEFDETARTITVRDNGIGMSSDEVVDNIGTIAKSGTAEFLKSLSGDKAKDASLIGQFGVGFYSCFIVADKVELITRRADLPAKEGVKWESKGEEKFSLTQVNRAKPGTEVVLHLREDEKEFLNGWRLKSIITKYSDHIGIPVKMLQEVPPVSADSEKEEKPAEAVWEVINSASALWARPKSKISKDEYKTFYKHVSHDFEDPLDWSHNRVEGKQEYISLLYIPAKAALDIFEPKQKHGLKLYVQRTFIMEDTEKLMPRYLRFVRGVVDSSDLPLNVSRELLQDNKIISGIRSGSVKKVLKMLETMAKKDADKYQQFWSEFGQVLKEGAAEDFANREQVLKLVRFASTEADTDVQTVSLEDYVARMKPGQEKIYYITADTFLAAKNSPHLEVLRKKGIEVLLMHDRVDEWVMGQVFEYDGKSFQSVSKGELDIDNVGDSTDKNKAKKNKATLDEKVLEKIKKALEDKVETVRVSSRLTSSPSCIVMNEHDMALYMQRLLKQAGQQGMPESKPALEVNPEHKILQVMAKEKNKARFHTWAELLLDQAILSEGGQLEDPAGFVKKMNDMMLSV